MTISITQLRNQAESAGNDYTEVLGVDLLTLVEAVEAAHTAWADFGNNVCIDIVGGIDSKLDDWLEQKFDFGPTA